MKLEYKKWHLYKPNQCTDTNDCQSMLDSVAELAKGGLITTKELIAYEQVYNARKNKLEKKEKLAFKKKFDHELWELMAYEGVYNSL